MKTVSKLNKNSSNTIQRDSQSPDSKKINIYLDFDIESLTVNGNAEHCSNYTSNTGNRLDTYEVISNIGFHLMHAKMIPQGPGSIHIRAMSAYVQFIFVIESPRSYSIDNEKAIATKVEELCQTVFYVEKGGLLTFEWEDTKPHEIFEISISLDYLLRLLPKEHFLYQNLQKALENGRSAYLTDFPMTIGPKLKSALYEMVYCKYEGLIKNLYIQGKLTELLALQQYKYERLWQESSERSEIPPIERERMLKLREILSGQLHEVPKINELARIVGTNECYLKQNFKQVFGTTVYGYIKQARMEKAKKLLIQSEKKISEIAQIIGYKHANHFTSAFKKYYGYTPNNLTKNKS